MTDKFSHIAEDGSVRMVDVSSKPISKRVATAEAVIGLRPETIAKIASNEVAKGNVLATARIAAIQAVKRTGELIPLRHPLHVHHVCGFPTQRTAAADFRDNPISGERKALRDSCLGAPNDDIL